MLGENNFNDHVTDYNGINNLNNKNNLTNKTNSAVNIFSSNNLNQSEAAIYFESSSSNYTDMEISMYNAIKLMHSEAYIKKYEDAHQNTIKMAGVWRDLGNALEYSPEKKSSV